MPTSRRHLMLGACLAGLAGKAMAQTPAAPEPIAIGALYPFSGGLALLGDESFRGLDLATDERNAAGGLLGRPVRLVRGDAVDPAAAAAETKRLITGERVAVIFGTAASPLSSAATQVSELAGVPLFELGAPADSITERGFKYLFRSAPMARQFAAASVDALGDVLAPLWNLSATSMRIAILQPDPQTGAGIAAAQIELCRQRGLAVVETLTFTAGSADAGAMLQRLRVANTDVVLHSGSANDVVQLFATMRQAGWRPRMLIGTGSAYSFGDTMQAAGLGFDGTMNVDVPPYRVNERVAAGAAAVAAAYQRKYGARP